MIYTRFILEAIVILIIIYYIMVVGHLFDRWKMTKREIKFSRLCVPFYYWIVSQEVKQETNIKRKRNNGKSKNSK